ncbi:MAG: DUF4235 domain-containing protein [Mycobacterium sp.]|nr:DUF4235 domain-containing protein [Mycobacterium sp.]
MSTISRSLYTPLSVATGIAGGLLASAVFKQLWKRIGDTGPPDPQDLKQPMSSVLIAATLQGLTWGLVRAAVQRASAHGYQAATDETPPV